MAKINIYTAENIHTAAAANLDSHIFVFTDKDGNTSTLADLLNAERVYTLDLDGGTLKPIGVNLHAVKFTAAENAADKFIAAVRMVWYARQLAAVRAYWRKAYSGVDRHQLKDDSDGAKVYDVLAARIKYAEKTLAAYDGKTSFDSPLTAAIARLVTNTSGGTHDNSVLLAGKVIIDELDRLDRFAGDKADDDFGDMPNVGELRKAITRLLYESYKNGCHTADGIAEPVKKCSHALAVYLYRVYRRPDRINKKTAEIDEKRLTLNGVLDVIFTHVYKMLTVGEDENEKQTAAALAPHMEKRIDEKSKSKAKKPTAEPTAEPTATK